MPSRRDLANAIRALSMDAVQKANSGHPGAPMGMADIAEVLWNDHMKYNPTSSKWADRDRFVLSNGHGSMLMYSLLHLTGFELSMDDIKDFRQLHAKTAGHPEYGYAEGIETTTGPLGQGITNAVGMAIAERTLGAQFNKPGHNIVDHNTYVFMGDGCLMEGLSHESCAMAGTLGLGKLIAFWDDNDISIDGHIGDWMEKGLMKQLGMIHLQHTRLNSLQMQLNLSVVWQAHCQLTLKLKWIALLLKLKLICQKLHHVKRHKQRLRQWAHYYQKCLVVQLT